MMNLSSSVSSSSCCLKKHTCSSSSTASLLGRRNCLKMGGFYDQGQLEYYKASVRVRCGSDKMKMEKKKKKKEVKLLKGLSKDLADFYGMGFGLNDEYNQQKKENGDGGLPDQFKFKMMSEAAELLLEQLKQVRAEEKELKKKMKMEEKMKKKAEQKPAVSVDCLESSSSSSSSESSDSESDNEMVADISRLNRNRNLELPSPGYGCSLGELPAVAEEGGVVSIVSSRLSQEKNRLGGESEGMEGKKIEVCMGGKCKKSGAATLMEEFQKVVGLSDDIVVSGCKCMGKCKNAPNVRVVDVEAPGNPLCLGVGVEDVGLIVSNFFGNKSPHDIVGIPAGAM